jgi:hypothetical protein
MDSNAPLDRGPLGVIGPVGRASRLSVALLLTGLATVLLSTGVAPTTLPHPLIHALASSHLTTDKKPLPLGNGSGYLTKRGPSSLPPFAPNQPVGKFYNGADYNGQSTTATTVSVTISVPHSGPARNDSYYVLVSIFDDSPAHWYDQIGLTPFYSQAHDDWGISYAQMGTCGTVPNALGAVDPNGQLNPGFAYVFEMSLGGGYLTYTVTTPTGAPIIWTLSVPDAATHFDVQSVDTCYNANDGYTDYEEVYNVTNQPVPNWDFNFTHNLAGGSAAGPWTLLLNSSNPATPHRYWMQTGADWVEIANQAIENWQTTNTGGPGYWSNHAGTSMSSGGTVSAVGWYCKFNPCYLTATLSLPTSGGWSGSVNYQPSPTAPTALGVLVNTPSNASGPYYVTLWTSISHTQGGAVIEWTKYVFYLLVT